jgi:DNA gyrase subunit A
VVAHDSDATVITGCQAGHGKRTPLSDYPIKGRGGQGVINIKTGGRNGRVVGVALARAGDDVLFITQTGMLVRTPVADISEMGRNTQGVRLVNLKESDQLVALEIVSEDDLERYATEEARLERKRPPLIMDEGPDEPDGIPPRTPTPGPEAKEE